MYRTDLPFVTKGIVDTFGVILPYFEFSMSLGTHLTRCWVGFEEVGGAELKIAEGKARKWGQIDIFLAIFLKWSLDLGVRPAKIAYDVFSEFELGETIGIGIHPRTAKLYITKNGEMLKSEVTQLRDHMGEKEFPTIRLSGGPCKFTLNLGAGEDPFLFSPYSYK